MGKFEDRFRNGKRIQAAIVEIYRTGLYKNINKVDFSGFYPSLIMTFNISPETTKMIGYEDYHNKLTYQFLDDEVILFKIPDINLQKTVLVTINQKQHGFLRDKLIEFKNIRDKIKIQLKDKSLPEQTRTELYSLSWSLKVLANSTGYGTNANAFFRYGDVSLAIAITGLARFFITEVLDMFPENKIEVDTDGIYVNCDINIEQVNKKIRDYCINNFKKDEKEIYLDIDLDKYDAGFFYKTKNYLLYDEGKIIRHGVTFMSSSKTELFNKCLNAIGLAVFEGKDIVQAIYQIIGRTNSIKDYVMKTKINRPIESYKNENCLQKQLARQVQQHLQQRLRVGDSVDYVKTRNGYTILTLAKLQDIDIQYYYNQLQTLVNIFTKQEIIITKGCVASQKNLLDY